MTLLKFNDSFQFVNLFCPTLPAVCSKFIQYSQNKDNWSY